MQALFSGNLGVDNEQELRVLCSEVQAALALGSARIRVNSGCLSSHSMFMQLVKIFKACFHVRVRRLGTGGSLKGTYLLAGCILGDDTLSASPQHSMHVPMSAQVYARQPRWKKYAKRLLHRSPDARFEEIVDKLNELTQQAWSLQTNMNAGAASSRCSISQSTVTYPSVPSLLGAIVNLSQYKDVGQK
jgi:hypothetical protein